MSESTQIWTHVFTCPLLNCAVQLRTRHDFGKVIAVIGNQGRPSENDYAGHMLYP